MAAQFIHKRFTHKRGFYPHSNDKTQAFHVPLKSDSRCFTAHPGSCWQRGSTDWWEDRIARQSWDDCVRQSLRWRKCGLCELQHWRSTVPSTWEPPPATFWLRGQSGEPWNRLSHQSPQWCRSCDRWQPDHGMPEDFLYPQKCRRTTGQFCNRMFRSRKWDCLLSSRQWQTICLEEYEVKAYGSNQGEWLFVIESGPLPLCTG